MKFSTPGDVYIKHNLCTQGLEREKRLYEAKVYNEIVHFSYGREDRPMKSQKHGSLKKIWIMTVPTKHTKVDALSDTHLRAHET